MPVVSAPVQSPHGGVVGLANAGQRGEPRLDLLPLGVEFVEDAVGLLHIVRADVERDPCVMLSLEGRRVAGAFRDPGGEESAGTVEVLPGPGGEARPNEFGHQRLEEVAVEPALLRLRAVGHRGVLVPAAGPHHLAEPRLEFHGAVPPDDRYLHGVEADPLTGPCVEPVQGLGELTPELGRDPHRDVGIEPGRVGEQLAEMLEVARFQLVLDRHPHLAAVLAARLRQDVEKVRADRHLLPDLLQRQPQLRTQEVEALSQPRREVVRLVGPFLADIDALDAFPGRGHGGLPCSPAAVAPAHDEVAAVEVEQRAVEHVVVGLEVDVRAGGHRPVLVRA